MAKGVGDEVVSVQKFEKVPPLCKKEELKIGAKKTVEAMKNSSKEVSELNDRTEELIQAAIILKEANAMKFNEH